MIPAKKEGHKDGYNPIPFFKGDVKESPRKDFLYWSDDETFAIRYNRWKITFYEQDHEGLDIWMKEYEKLRVPKIFDLRADPFERGDSSFMYDNWMVHRIYFAYGLAGLRSGQGQRQKQEQRPKEKQEEQKTEKGDILNGVRKGTF